MRITVLGAGYMGTAMAKVLASSGHTVRLWGTWLDDDLLGPCERGEEHPRLKLAVPELSLFRSAQLREALRGAELVVSAVSSEGVAPVLLAAAPDLPDVPVLSPTKGFLRAPDGAMERIDEAATRIVGRPLRYVHAAGPAKAMELARGVPTLMTFAGAEAAFCKNAMSAPHMRVGLSQDITGAEICSALKNAYATGLGIWDGLFGNDAHNARAAWFTQAIEEMRIVAVASGGLAATVYGSPGVGDLHVTAAAGRNRLFGEHIGRGKPARDVAKELAAMGQLTEGYPAIASAWAYAKQRNVSAELPLLKGLHQIVWSDAPAKETALSIQLTV